MQSQFPGKARVWSGRGLQAPLALALLFSSSLSARDPQPLHERIDRAVESAHVGPAAPLADDAAFVRRVFLDLTGRIPASRDARAFLDDPSPDKRARLIDRLLAGPEHVRHMAVTFDVWLMERRADKHVKTEEWRTWLAASFAANRPYNELAGEILGADGADPARRAPARFTLDREVAPDALTRDVGRVFFGMDLQCAQCHDHPRIEDYLQRDYYGLYAFVNRASLFQPDAKKPAVVAEKGEGDVSFKSVFTKAEGITRPRLPDGAEIEEPAFAKGDEWQVKPDPKDKTVRAVPRFSRRAALARLAGEGASRAFNRNIANRLWAHLMGRGLVEPVDLHHSDNPPAHPELLEMLAGEFAALKYDIRAFLRELALTRTYQRGIELPARLAEESKPAAGKLAALDAEAKRLDEAAAGAEEAARKTAGELEAARKASLASAPEQARAEAALAEARKALDAARKELAARQELHQAVSEAALKASEAASRLAGDAELAGAAATFRARAERLAGELAPMAKDAAAKAELAVSAEKAAAAARAARAEADARVKSLAKALAQAEALRKESKVAAAHASRRAADTRAFAEYGALHEAAARSRDEVRWIRAELALAKSPAEGPAREAKWAEAKKAGEAAVLARDAARQDLAAKEEALRAVSEAAAKAEEVARKAAQDAELVSAAARVKGRRDSLGAELAGLRKAADQGEDACRKAAETLAAAERARAEVAAAKERRPLLEAGLKPAAEKASADEARRDEAFGKLSAVWTQRFALAPLDPLTPEQICWSMMQATGIVDRERAAAEAEVAKRSPPVPEADRARAVEQAVYDKLKSNEAPFVRLFGGGPGQPQDDFYATVDQALFLANGGLVRGWLAPGRVEGRAPAGGNLTDRLVMLEDPGELARELYLGVFTRRPTAAEADEVARYLGARPQAKLAAVQEMVWAMLTSVEFRFKH